MSDTLARPLDKAQLTAAVAALRDEAVTLLSDLVRHPSLLGDERSAQDHMRGVFEAMGLRVDEFAIDEAKIKDHPGYSPSIVSYDGRHNVVGVHEPKHGTHRSEEHTSELQSLMRISYAVFCLQTKNN